MYKINMTHAKNIIVCLLGLVMAFGIGSLEPYMMLVYAAISIFVFLTRTRFYYLAVVSQIITLILFVINFTFMNGCVGSFAAGNQFFVISMVLSIGCVAIYFIANILILSKKIPEKKIKNASKR